MISLGAGAVTLIEFADGSTQTTAVPIGTWCGMHTVPSFVGTDANYPDMWVNGAYVNANIKCQGVDTASSCPVGYMRLQWAFLGFNGAKN